MLQALLSHKDINHNITYKIKTAKNFLSFLGLAVKSGDIKVVETLLACPEVEVNPKSRLIKKPVFLALENGEAAIFKLLVSRGAELNLEDNYPKELSELANKFLNVIITYKIKNERRDEHLNQALKIIAAALTNYDKNNNSNLAQQNLLSKMCELKTQVEEDHKQHGKLSFPYNPFFSGGFTLTTSQLANQLDMVIKANLLSPSKKV